MRLIDADELKVYLQEYLHYEHAIPWVDAQPTAYDVEMVVEELESLRIDKSNYFGVLNVVAEKYDRANEMLNDAIDIVRKGGVE